MGTLKDTTRRNLKRHYLKCCMCGEMFFAARSDATSCSNLCRSALRRWTKLYGAPPIAPPGRGNLRPVYWNKGAFFAAYVNAIAYTAHKQKDSKGGK